MPGRGMGSATQGGGAVASGAKNKMIRTTSKTTGPVMMKDGGAVKRPMGMPAQAQGKGLSKMPPGMAKRPADKPMPAGIARTRAALLKEPVKLQAGGMPPQAAAGMARRPTAMPAQAAAGMARRPTAMPAQAVGARPFKQGGDVKKMRKGGSCK